MSAADRPPPPVPEPLDREPRAKVVECLFREHNEALLRFLALRLGSQDEAREVAQEAYVKLLRLEESGAISFLRTFLFTIAANLATDRMRVRRRRHFSSSMLFDEFSSEQPTPERQVASEQELAVVSELIAELPPKCRRAFLLHRVTGLTTADIAVQMGLSERMVRHHILRAVEHCRLGLDAAAAARKDV